MDLPLFDVVCHFHHGSLRSRIKGWVHYIIPEVRGYFISFLSWAWGGVVWCWKALFESYSYPGWVWLLLLLFASIGIANIYRAIKSESEQPEFKSYVEDRIHDVIWRWKWNGNQVSNIWCFCPRCDATLVYDDSSCRSYYSNDNKTDFICENCNRSVVTSICGGDKDYATGAVKREIDRRIRTGEYKKH